jgi:hypothetical protein
MRRTTIMIPDELKMRALKHASIMGISLGRFIRETLERALQQPNGNKSDDTLFTDDAVSLEETPVDLAQNHDDYLYGDKS